MNTPTQEWQTGRAVSLTPQHRAKIGLGTRRNWKHAGIREARRNGMRAAWQDPHRRLARFVGTALAEAQACLEKARSPQAERYARLVATLEEAERLATSLLPPPTSKAKPSMVRLQRAVESAAHRARDVDEVIRLVGDHPGIKADDVRRVFSRPLGKTRMFLILRRAADAGHVAVREERGVSHGRWFTYWPVPRRVEG